MHSSVIGLVFIVLVIFLAFPVSAELTVRFLDVGEGDAVLLQSEDKTMLIDSGPRDSGNLTRAYLNHLNISTLDMVMITSPDERRTGALLNIMNSTYVGNLLCGIWNSTEPSYKDVLTRISENNTQMTFLKAGDQVIFTDQVSINLLSPGNTSGNIDSNNLVPLITCGDVRFLLMGDEPVVSGNVSAQILRVADHGSREGSDTSFILKVKPEVAIVSTGINDVGNPVTGTLNLLENTGASVLRTDIDGVITITTDGKDYIVGKLRMEPEITISVIGVVETRSPT